MKNRLVCTLILTVILFTTACSPLNSLAPAPRQPDYWPTTGWKHSTPEAQGMDSNRLALMLEELNTKQTRIHSLIIIRNGYLVTEAYFHPYHQGSKVHVQSITKSVIGALGGIAIKQGYIHSADDFLMSFYPNRVVKNPGPAKDSIQLKHLLSMSSGLDCQEFSSSSKKMEQVMGWVAFMLDLPVVTKPGEKFGYCNGNAHLLSAIVDKTTGMNARLFANQELFQPLGIPPVKIEDWGEDPQHFTTGGYGLHLTPLDMAKFAFLYLHNGTWQDQQILPPDWVAESTTQQVLKDDGSAYGYLWTVYPADSHYAALGLGGQQIHVFPAQDLIVIITADLEAYAEAPEIEAMLSKSILPAAKSVKPLAENAQAAARLKSAIEIAANPIKAVPALPTTALEISNRVYTFADNPMGWQKVFLEFSPAAKTALVNLNGIRQLEIGLDNLYRPNPSDSFGDLHLRGRWIDEHTFVIDYPYALSGIANLAELGESEIRLTFNAEKLTVTANQLIFAGEPISFSGSR